MNDPLKLVRLSFSSSIGSLSGWYDLLSGLTPDERVTLMEALKAEEKSIKDKIQSPEIQSDIVTQALYMYFWRLKYKLNEPDCFLRHGFEHLVHKLEKEKSFNNEFSHFYYGSNTESSNKSSKERFLKLIMDINECVDFSTIVDFVVCTCFQQRSRKITIEEWFEEKFIYTCEDDYEYQQQLEEAQNKWFNKEKAIKNVQAKFLEKWKINQKAKIEINQIFPNYLQSGKRLEDLVVRERQNFLNLYYAEDAYKALNENVQKKHMLMEEGLKSMKIYSQLSKGL